jgi:hypothetical protein
MGDVGSLYERNEGELFGGQRPSTFRHATFQLGRWWFPHFAFVFAGGVVTSHGFQIRCGWLEHVPRPPSAIQRLPMCWFRQFRICGGRFWLGQKNLPDFTRIRSPWTANMPMNDPRERIA